MKQLKSIGIGIFLFLAACAAAFGQSATVAPTQVTVPAQTISIPVQIPALQIPAQTITIQIPIPAEVVTVPGQTIPVVGLPSGSSSSSSSGGSSSSGSSSGSSSSSSSSSGATGVFGLKVSGPKILSTQNNAVVQLRGVNVAGLDGDSILGSPHPWDWSNLTGGNGADPDWSKIVAWKANAVRLPMNEASWLGLTTKDANGANRSADPSGDYQATVIRSVKEANAAGLYVILDLHWNAPGNFSPITQNAFMDSDHSLAFWTSVANTFKNNPAVAFELFNEPYLHEISSGADGMFNTVPNANQSINAGGLVASDYAPSSGVRTAATWTVVGYQQAITAVRATGAPNVIICGGQGYDNDDTWWTSNPPSDPLKQLVMTMHAYPSTWGYSVTGGSQQFTAAQSIAVLAGPGVPVLFTEVGDATGAGQTGSFISKVLSVADAQGWGVFAWTWNPWGGANTLIQDIKTYTPTVGEGTTYQAWLLNHK